MRIFALPAPHWFQFKNEFTIYEITRLANTTDTTPHIQQYSKVALPVSATM